MAHVQPEELQLILDGRATSDGLDEAVMHLSGCEACQSMARTEAQSLDVVLGVSTPDSNARTAFGQGSRLGVFNVIGPLSESEPDGPFLAVDQRDGQNVALHLERSSFEGVVGLLTRKRFWKDARAVSRLSHPNVLRLHQTGIYKDRLFMAFELVKGIDLGTWLKQSPRTWSEVVAIFIEAGQGLAAAHAVDLAHGDFGPLSVVVTEERGVKVSRFALALLRDTVLQRDSATRTSPFMSPEQRKGGEPNALGDQFSFCAALDAATVSKPRWLKRALARGMSAEPTKRWPSMNALLDRLAHPPFLGLF